MAGYICYRGDNHVLIMNFETGRDDDSAATRHGGLECESIPVCVG